MMLRYSETYLKEVTLFQTFNECIYISFYIHTFLSKKNEKHLLKHLGEEWSLKLFQIPKVSMQFSDCDPTKIPGHSYRYSQNHAQIFLCIPTTTCSSWFIATGTRNPSADTSWGWEWISHHLKVWTLDMFYIHLRWYRRYFILLNRSH